MQKTETLIFFYLQCSLYCRLGLLTLYGDPQHILEVVAQERWITYEKRCTDDLGIIFKTLLLFGFFCYEDRLPLFGRVTGLELMSIQRIVGKRAAAIRASSSAI